MIHALKQLTPYFEAVLSGEKTFEIRLKDRDYRVGDLLALNEYDGERYTGRCCLVKIDYILDDSNYCLENYVTMSIKPCLVDINDGCDCRYNHNIFSVPEIAKSPMRKKRESREVSE